MARRRQRPTPPATILDDLILACGVPLGALARRAGIDSKTLLALRTAPPARPRIATMVKLAKALGVEPKVVRAAIEAQRG